MRYCRLVHRPRCVGETFGPHSLYRNTNLSSPATAAVTVNRGNYTQLFLIPVVPSVGMNYRKDCYCAERIYEIAKSGF